MSTYTESDLTAIQEAKRKMALGDRVGEFTHGTTRIRYADVSMSDLDRMESQILTSLRRRPRQLVVFSDKGL